MGGVGEEGEEGEDEEGEEEGAGRTHLAALKMRRRKSMCRWS